MEINNLATDSTVTSVGKIELQQWLSNIPRHENDLIQAIKSGRVKVTTTAGFGQITDKVKEYAQLYANTEFEKSTITTDRTVLLNTIFYLLKSCEGIARNANLIGDITAVVLANGKEPNLKSIITALIVDTSKLNRLINAVQVLCSGFDPTYLTRIDLKALAPMLKEIGIDTDMYEQIPAQLSMSILPTLPTETPAS